MNGDLKSNVMAALSTVRVPGGAGDIVSNGMVEGLHLDKGDAAFSIRVDPAMGPAMEEMRLVAERAVRSVKGILSASCVLTAERPGAEAAPDPHGMNKNPPLELPVQHIVAVASGKGGVGKSTVAYNIALAFAGKGMTTALLDADIYGPSVPCLAGLAGEKPLRNADGKIVPILADGVSLMSMGFLVDEEKPMIWRGPMVQTAFYQLLRDVEWRRDGKDLDVMVIDMPPGTGDVQLTLAQKVPVTGAVIVSTPQDLALIDARKAIAMFEKTGVPILGLVENMSYHVCTNCGHREHIFSHGGARDEAQKRSVPFLGEIPLSIDIREIGTSKNGEKTAALFSSVTDNIITALSGDRSR